MILKLSNIIKTVKLPKSKPTMETNRSNEDGADVGMTTGREFNM